MKARKLTLTEQVEILEMANQTLKQYIHTLEEKLARYERIMQRCPKFRMEQSGAKYSVCDGERIAISNAPIHQLPAGSTVRISHPLPPMADADGFDAPEEDDWQDEDDWDGLEESDFADDWDDEDFDYFDEDFEDDFEDEE